MTISAPAPTKAKQPWQQLEGETGKAYSAFVEYLQLGDSRSMEAVSEKLQKGVGTLRRWSEKYAWVARAHAYTGWMESQKVELMAIAQAEKLTDWAKRQKELREEEYTVARECIGAARKFLNVLLERDGGARLSPSDVAKLLEVASKLGRLSAGMPTEHTEVTGADGGPIRVEVSQALEKVYGLTLDIPESGISLNPVFSDTEGKKIAPSPISAPAIGILKDSQNPENGVTET